MPVYATQAAGAQAQEPLGRACRRAQGGQREGTQGARLPPGPGWGMSSGSSEYPRERIMHSNKNVVIERKAMPRELHIPWGHQIKGSFRRKKYLR